MPVYPDTPKNKKLGRVGQHYGDDSGLKKVSRDTPTRSTLIALVEEKVTYNRAHGYPEAKMVFGKEGSKGRATGKGKPQIELGPLSAEYKAHRVAETHRISAEATASAKRIFENKQKKKGHLSSGIVQVAQSGDHGVIKYKTSPEERKKMDEKQRKSLGPKKFRVSVQKPPPLFEKMEVAIPPAPEQKNIRRQGGTFERPRPQTSNTNWNKIEIIKRIEGVRVSDYAGMPLGPGMLGYEYHGVLPEKFTTDFSGFNE
jgi:hypothetical protein